MAAGQLTAGTDDAFERARALLSGGANPTDALTGLKLIDEAAAAGHAEATVTAAVFHALGAMREQSWPRAFDLLARAAEIGSESARQQLRLLAGEDDQAMSDWTALRSRIDIQGLLKSRPQEPLSDGPLARKLTRFASAAECQWVIGRARPRLQQAALWRDDGARVGKQRSNSAFAITVGESDLVIEILRARIGSSLQLPVMIFEPPQILHYSVGQEFVPHYDFLDPKHPSQAAAIAQAGQRMGTFLIYLNGDFEGGETDFPSAGLKFRGSTGDALFFSNLTRDGRPDPLTLHAGRPPTEGEKWVMSTWIRDRTPG